MRRRALAAQQAPPFKIAGDGPTPLLPERPDFVLAPAQVERRHACPGAARGDGGNALQQARPPSAQQAELIKRLVSAAGKGDCYIASGRHVYLALQSCPKVRNMIIAEIQYSVVASRLGDGLFPYLYEYLYEEVGGWVLSPKQLPQERRSWKDGFYDYRKESVELLFQRIMQALVLKGCHGKGRGRNGAFAPAIVRLYQICYLTNYREDKSPACI